MPTLRSSRAGSSRGSPRLSILLVVATFTVAAGLAYQFYRVTGSEEVMASRTRAAYAAFAAAELAREATRVVEDEGRRVLLPVAAAAVSQDRVAVSPAQVLLAAAGTPDRRDAAGILRPRLAFRLELATGRLDTAGATTPSAPTGIDATQPPGSRTRWRPVEDDPLEAWLPAAVRRVLAGRRASGLSVHGARALTVEGRLVAFATVPGEDGDVRLVYGMISDADAVAHDVVAHVAAHHTLLPLAPLGGEENDAALRLSVRGPGGVPVYRSPGPRVGVEPVELAMNGPLAPYTVRASLAPDFATNLADVAWTWNQAQTAIALLTFVAGLIVVTLWQLRRERAMARLRSDFVSNVSHELRTPLAQIRMFAEMLRLGWVRSDAERQRAIAIIDQEARRLTRLVENVLQFSRPDEAARRLSPRSLALEPFLHEVVDGFGILLASRSTTIALQVQPGLRLTADPDALQQVLLNLLDNAVKYGPPAQTITIGAAPLAAGGVRVWVEDQGPGIPLTDRRRIFEPYRRGARHDRVTGSGIGLAVVRDLVHAHNGAIWVEEGEDARGARFVFTLPLIAPDDSATGATPDEAPASEASAEQSEPAERRTAVAGTGSRTD